MPRLDRVAVEVDFPAAVNLAFISARTDAAAAENWREVTEGRVEELVRQSVEMPSGKGKLLISGYKFELCCVASGEVAVGRLISRIVSVEIGEVRRLELGRALMMRSGWVVSPSSSFLIWIGGSKEVRFRDGVGVPVGNTIVFLLDILVSSSSSSSVSIPSNSSFTSSIALTISETLFCLVRGVSGGYRMVFCSSSSTSCTELPDSTLESLCLGRLTCRRTATLPLVGLSEGMFDAA